MPYTFLKSRGCLLFTKFSQPLHPLYCIKKTCPLSSFVIRLSAYISGRKHTCSRQVSILFLFLPSLTVINGVNITNFPQSIPKVATFTSPSSEDELILQLSPDPADESQRKIVLIDLWPHFIFAQNQLTHKRCL